MTKKTKFHTDVSKMRFDGRVSQAYWNGEQAMRMIYNKEVVFNRAEYHLDVPETVELEAVGTKDEPLSNFIGIESYKIDYDGARSEITYRGGSDKIAANNTTEPKEGVYTITQEWSALQISGRWTQAGNDFLHYSFKQIRSVSVDYDEAFAGGGDVEPHVMVNLWLLEHWSDESTVDKYVSYRGSVTSATGKVISDNAVGSYSTINSKTGVVTVPSLGTTVKDARDVFTVETLSGTVTIPEVDGGKVVSWNWGSDEDYKVKQMENYKRETGTPKYTLNSSVSTTELNAVDTSFKVTGSAFKTSYYYYDSNPADIKSTDTNETLYVLLDGNVNDARHLVGKDASTTFTVGVNTSIESDRTFKVRVYNTGLGYDKTHTVTQKKNSMTTYWTAPVLNGDIVIENILANGSGVTISVPIKQQKYGKVEGVATDTLLETFTDSVFATGVGGTAVDGTGATFKDGVMSANNMGTTIYPSGRTVYNLSSVTVTGKDDKPHTLQLPAIIEIKQNKNERYTAYGAYVLSVSADPTTGIANTGGTSKISATAQQNVTYTWDSGATPVDDKINVKGTLSTTIGTFEETKSNTASFTGSGSATLTFGENIAAARTATITLSVEGNKKTCTVSQKAVSYVFNAVKPDVPYECGPEASKVSVKFESSRNGGVWAPQKYEANNGATINQAEVSSTNNIYTVPVSIPANNTYEARDIVVTATQERWDNPATATASITQGGLQKPSNPTMNVYGYGSYANASKSSALVTVVFDASVANKYDGGTVKGVYAWLSNKNDGTGDMVGAGWDIGDVTVQQGKYTSKSHTFTGTSGYAKLYLYIRYDEKTLPAEQIEDYQPE